MIFLKVRSQYFFSSLVAAVARMTSAFLVDWSGNQLQLTRYVVLGSLLLLGAICMQLLISIPDLQLGFENRGWWWASNISLFWLRQWMQTGWLFRGFCGPLVLQKFPEFFDLCRWFAGVMDRVSPNRGKPAAYLLIIQVYESSIRTAWWYDMVLKHIDGYVYI